MEEAEKWVPTIVNGGFAIALSWYLVAKAIPRIVADFRADITSMSQQFVAELRSTREDFARELAEERKHCAEHRRAEREKQP